MVLFSTDELTMVPFFLKVSSDKGLTCGERQITNVDFASGFVYCPQMFFSIQTDSGEAGQFAIFEL